MVIHSGTVIGDGCEIQDGAVLGKRPRLGRALDARRASELEPLVVGAGRGRLRRARSCTPARASAQGAIVGDQAQVRERSAVGAGRVIGRGTRRRERRHASAPACGSSRTAILAAHAVVEDDVFVGPGRRHDQRRHDGPPRPPGEPLRARVLRRGCRIGGGAVLTPGVEVGEEAFVAAGAVVTRDVPAARGGDGRAGARRCARCRRTDLLRHERADRRAVSGASAVLLPTLRRLDRLEQRTLADGRGRARARSGAVAVGEVGRLWRRRVVAEEPGPRPR